jgi:hypothetical protein
MSGASMSLARSSHYLARTRKALSLIKVNKNVNNQKRRLTCVTFVTKMPSSQVPQLPSTFPSMLFQLRGDRQHVAS